jgi:hypothetical protein
VSRLSVQPATLTGEAGQAQAGVARYCALSTAVFRFSWRPTFRLAEHRRDAGAAP